jgi:hypothetical protein
MSAGRKPIDPIERFHSKYIVNEETGCWEWNGTFQSTGYGFFWYGNRNVYAHRYSYETFVSKISKNDVIMHLCDNPKCVNFNHLKSASQSDNMKDMVKKNRQAKGSMVAASKLKDNQILEIKSALLNPYRGIQKHLANKYNVTQACICRINKGLAWSHIKI